jgi:23S rRNA pseudouridine1911/1915/1917 synthase
MDEPFAIFVAGAPARLDRVVAERLSLSRSRVRVLLDRGWVLVDGVPVREAGRRVEGGQSVRVLRDPALLERPRPVDLPVDLLAEGDGWVALDKPPGLAIHPLEHDEADSLLQRALVRWPQLEDVGERGLRGGVVHRLDVDTSGVQLLATDEATWRRLRSAFAAHRMDKVYRALVFGDPPEHGSVELDLELARHRPARVRASAAGEGSGDARRCGLRWRVRERLEGGALVEVRPRTGFLHQVRVSLAWAGYPLAGDRVYGKAPGPAPRHMLHACRLSFEEIEVASADAPDFAHELERWRREGAAGGTAAPVAY